LTNKYAEGYPGKRYYQGNKIVDGIEQLAIDRIKKLFNLEHVNVQPYSGSPANSAVLLALLEPGDKICGMKLSAGGHLTHGHPLVTFSGKFFNSVQYDVEPDGRINYDKLSEMVYQELPKLIFCGATAYPFIIDWEKLGEIADGVGAWLVADISHIAGLIAGGVHQSPVPFVHLITSTTHKTLRGPRGAFIGVTSKGISFAKSFGILDLGKLIDRAVFPGLQGGPHLNNIAGIAVAMAESNSVKFKEYARQVVKNAKALADYLRNVGAQGIAPIQIFGTENHLMVVDVGFEKGKEVAEALEEAGIICNANTIPHDTAKPFKPSGIRLGTPAMTTRGFKEKDFEKVGEWIGRVIKGEDRGKIRVEVEEYLKKF